jgi:hypothetical protein
VGTGVGMGVGEGVAVADGDADDVLVGSGLKLKVGRGVAGLGVGVGVPGQAGNGVQGDAVGDCEAAGGEVEVSARTAMEPAPQSWAPVRQTARRANAIPLTERRVVLPRSVWWWSRPSACWWRTGGLYYTLTRMGCPVRPSPAPVLPSDRRG